MEQFETPRVIVRNKLVINFIQMFKKLGYKRRTVKMLSECIGETEDNILKTLVFYPDVFTPVKGCKGDMWYLNKLGDA